MLAPWTPLWPQGAPLALGTAEEDVPALRHYAPTAAANGAAMLVLPGGGYGQLSPHEGEGYAIWLAGLGYEVFELRYRLAPNGYGHAAIMADARRAMRSVRSLAATRGFCPESVGVIGSSAGGHLAGYLSVCHDAGEPGAEDPVERMSSRPDLAVLCYPVITLRKPQAHEGSCANLFGAAASPEERDSLSLETLVTPSTPPCFLWHTVADPAVPVENSLLFAGALRKAGVPFDLHLYAEGRHGLGLAGGHPWTLECARWLEAGFTK